MAGAPKLRIALAQVNPTVGDLEGNARLVAEWIGRAREAGADLVLFGELVIPGYPAEDLYLKRHFVEANLAALREAAAAARGISALVGFAEPVPGPLERRHDAPSPHPVRNALALCAEGEVRAVYRKSRLPNYAVFDEERYFARGSELVVEPVAGVPVGLTICEDLWVEGPPGSELAGAGAALVVNASGSPYLRGKGTARERMFAERARDFGLPIAFCNLVGGQDELVFDGQSFVVGAGGEPLARGRQFAEDLVVCDLDAAPGELAEPLDDLDEVYAALCLGLRDYAAKNGFGELVLGLSGGIDSALVALLAAEALGAERLLCVSMPSPHSSEGTRDDARAIAANLGAELLEIPIEPGMRAYDEMLAPAGGVEGLAAENVQARIRGNILMAISNSRGSLVLTTGNKSEMSVGYATLYGDMAGGLAVLKDVPKQLVYGLVEHRSARAGRELIPASVIERPPSAELRPGQRDEDSLPPYDVLDRVLEAYVERDLSVPEIAAQEGIPAELAAEVVAMVNRAEYKRRQAPPGIRITSKAFGRDRRIPITNRFDQ